MFLRQHMIAIFALFDALGILVRILVRLVRETQK